MSRAPAPQAVSHASHGCGHSGLGTFSLWSLESCLGPLAQGKAQLSKPSLSLLVAYFRVFLCVPWLQELELTGQCLIHPHLSIEVRTA